MMLELFVGTDDSGAFSTVPEIFNTLLPTFEVTVIVFVKGPGRPCVLYVAVIFEVLPGAELCEDPESHEWLEGFLFAQAGSIYAGSNEIQRNIIAERLLGLPKN